jgi:hypothetical protein
MAFRAYDAALAFLHSTVPLASSVQNCIAYQLAYRWKSNHLAPSTPPSMSSSTSRSGYAGSDGTAPDAAPPKMGHEGLLSELSVFFEGSRTNSDFAELAGQGPGNMIAKRFVSLS